MKGWTWESFRIGPLTFYRHGSGAGTLGKGGKRNWAFNWRWFQFWRDS